MSHHTGFSLGSFEKPEHYTQARDLLQSAGYTPRGVLDRTGLSLSSASRGVEALPPNSEELLVRHTESGGRLDTLIRLFLAGVSCDLTAAAEAIAPMSLEQWGSAGLLGVHGGQVTALVKLLPFNEWLIAYDRRSKGSTADNFVLGVGLATLATMDFMVRRQLGLALDLGTGCGVLSLDAASRSSKVIATDRNIRAIRFAEFNSRLNSATNVECRVGDRFEPVRESRFDLIVSNAPFVISPESGYIALDGGMQGDRFCREMIESAPQFMAEGGYCQVLLNWAHYKNQDWKERLADWFAGNECDVLVVRTGTRDASSYARIWIEEIQSIQNRSFGDAYSEWMDYYEREGIEAVSTGLITMRRTSRNNWIRIDETPDIIGPCGDDIVRLFEARDFLVTHADDSRLLKSRLLASPDLLIERQFAISDANWNMVTSRIRLSRGLAFSATLDNLAAEFICRCDGKRTVDAILQNLEQSLGLDRTKVESDCLRVIVQCIKLGFLRPMPT